MTTVFRTIAWVPTLSMVLWMSSAACSRSDGNTSRSTATIEIPADVIVDKIRGGMLGQILGNLNGLKHEMQYIDEPGNVEEYTPALPSGAWTDDDTDFEWVYVMEMQRQRKLRLSSDEITALWQERINDRIWCANRYARYLMDVGFQPTHTGNTILNPWSSFNISGTFLAETFALMAPAMPQTASRIGLNYTTVAITAEPAQGTQLLTTMIATAFVENDVNKILDAGVAALEPGSRLLQVVNDVRRWHGQHPDDWRATRRLLRDTYTQERGNMRDRNGYELNTGAVIAALLYGNGDFAETLRIAFSLGWDADNVAANAGSILGVVHGYRQMLHRWDIVDRYRNTTRDNMPMDETITSFADRLVDLFEMVVEENGGGKKVVNQTLVYEIPVETPGSVLPLAPPDEEQRQLRTAFEQDIVTHLLRGSREEKARAAYLAVTLDMHQSLSEQHPDEWREAAYLLSGYWKIMRNLFQDSEFIAMEQLREKFRNAGFKAPSARTSDRQLYEDPEFWKDPALLY